jgi:hypothetical protein
MLIHVANVLLLCSYAVRDILWLRVLSVIASGCFMAYFGFGPQVVPAVVGWNAIFATINALQVRRLLLERGPVQLTAPQLQLWKQAFRTLTPREVVKLEALGEWQEVPAGHVLCRSGELLDRLLIITEGNAVIRVDGEAVAQVGAGQFIGEMSYLTRALASADVETTEPTRYLGWRSESLRAFLEKNSELRAALQMVLSSDLAQKLKG